MEASALSAPVTISRLTLSGPLLRLRSDEQLVALFRGGSDAAFDVIHDRYRARLLAYARQMLGGSRQDAEDALQDVFLRAYAALRADDRPISLRAWLYRVAHNRCIDHIRRPAPVHADVFEASRTPEHDTLAEAQQREDLRRLVADVRRLPETQRSALLMREMDGLSYEELAGALDTTVPAIKSLLVRARIGLVEAAEARDTACPEIRAQLAAASDRGVRASGQARRHMRECEQCREYRGQLRAVRRGFAALAPVGAGPLGLLAQALGIGGSSAGAGAGATAVATGGGGGGLAALGGGAAVATAGKVAVIVVSVGVVAAGAAEQAQQAPPARQAVSAAAPARQTPLVAAFAPAVVDRALHPQARREKVVAAEPAPTERAKGPVAATTPAGAKAPAAPIVVDPLVTGGSMAPADAADDVTGEVVGTPQLAGSGAAPGVGSATGTGTSVSGTGSGTASGSGSSPGSAPSSGSGSGTSSGSGAGAQASGAPASSSSASAGSTP